MSWQVARPSNGFRTSLNPWGDTNDAMPTARTVDVHVRRLREALSPAAKDRLIQTVRGAGYRLSAKD